MKCAWLNHIIKMMSCVLCWAKLSGSDLKAEHQLNKKHKQRSFYHGTDNRKALNHNPEDFTPVLFRHLTHWRDQRACVCVQHISVRLDLGCTWRQMTSFWPVARSWGTICRSLNYLKQKLAPVALSREYNLTMTRWWKDLPISLFTSCLLVFCSSDRSNQKCAFVRVWLLRWLWMHVLKKAAKPLCVSFTVSDEKKKKKHFQTNLSLPLPSFTFPSWSFLGLCS